MLIVSQDKTKITENLEFKIISNMKHTENYIMQISSDLKGLTYHDLKDRAFGVYPTEKRAKEVLKEMVERYRQITPYEDDEVMDIPKVYEMPEV